MIAHHCEIPPSSCPRSESLFSFAVRERYENRRINGHHRFLSRVTANKKSARSERFNYRMWDLLRVANRQSFSTVKTIHFSTLFQNSLREKIGRISDSTAITIQKRIVMAVLSLHNSLLCYLCSGKVLYVTTWTYGTVVWHLFCPPGASTLLIRGKHRAPLGQAPCPILVFLFSLPMIVIWLFDYLRNKWQTREVSDLI